jgi:hypothetical protein
MQLIQMSKTGFPLSCNGLANSCTCSSIMSYPAEPLQIASDVYIHGFVNGPLLIWTPCRTNLIKDENIVLLAAPNKIDLDGEIMSVSYWIYMRLKNLGRLKYSSLGPEPSAFEFEMVTEERKKTQITKYWWNSSRSDLIRLGKFFLRSISILTLVGKIRNYMSRATSQSCYVFIRKGDKIYCSNDLGITLLSTAYRILSIILSRLTPKAEKINGYHLCVIRGNRSTTVHI